MPKLHVTADIGLGHGRYHVGLSLVEFEEDNVTILYSPTLDLSGYGYDKDEARKSFHEALQEFFRYTNNKSTLNKVLKELGWATRGSKKNPTFKPPKDSDLITSNPLYKDIVNTKNYKVSKEEVEFAY